MAALTKNHTRPWGLSSCADHSKTRIHPPAGCGTTFELHWKAVETPGIAASCQAASKVLLNFFDWVAACTFPHRIQGKVVAVAKTFFRHRHRRALIHVRKENKVSFIVRTIVLAKRGSSIRGGLFYCVRM